MMSSRSRSVTIASVLLLWHCMPALSRAETMRDMIESYQADAELLSRHWSISGDSEAELTREKKLLHDWQGRLKGVDFEKLPADQRVEYVLLRNELESSLTGLVKREAERRELSTWLPIRQAIDSLADARVRGEPLVPEKAAGLIAPLTDKITKLQEQLKVAKEAAKQPKKPAAPAPKPENAQAAKPADKPNAPSISAKSDAKAIALPSPYQALRAAEAVGELAGSLKRWFENYNGFTPEFGWWVKQPYDATAKALENYGKFLREELAGIKGKDDDPLLGKVIGAEELQQRLGYEFIPYTPQELITLAEREFSWCEQQMKNAAQEMKLGDDWKKALARTKTRYVKPGEQETVVREEGREAIEFVKSHHLVTVPPDCEEWWGTRMLSPGEQKQIPYAAYGGHDMLVAYASDAMKHEDKLMSMRGNNRHFTRNVGAARTDPRPSPADFMAARNKPYRAHVQHAVLCRGLGALLGDALWDLGYRRTPEDEDRHALLAHAPLRAHHRHAEVSPRPDEAGRDGRLPRRPRRPRKIRRHERGAALHQRRLLAAVPVRLHARRAATAARCTGKSSARAR